MENNDNENKSTTYTVVDFSSDKKSSKNTHFGKNILLPFCSGILGASLVMAICFGIPEVNKLITDNGVNTSHIKNSNTSYSDKLTEVSLTNLSDTGISVANKVRPSIVLCKFYFLKRWYCKSRRFWNYYK